LLEFFSILLLPTDKVLKVDGNNFKGFLLSLSFLPVPQVFNALFQRVEVFIWTFLVVLARACGKTLGLQLGKSPL
jgi:hypothetical protein